MYENFAAAFFAALPFLCVIFIQSGVCGRQAGREEGNWRVARGKADLLHIILALVLYKPTAAHVPLASVVLLMLARGRQPGAGEGAGGGAWQRNFSGRWSWSWLRVRSKRLAKQN